MTRKEQIEAAAKEFCEKSGDSTDASCFIKAVEWADANKKYPETYNVYRSELNKLQAKLAIATEALEIIKQTCDACMIDARKALDKIKGME